MKSERRALCKKLDEGSAVSRGCRYCRWRGSGSERLGENLYTYSYSLRYRRDRKSARRWERDGIGAFKGRRTKAKKLEDDKRVRPGKSWAGVGKRRLFEEDGAVGEAVLGRETGIPWDVVED